MGNNPKTLRSKGFTFIELLVTMTVLAGLATLVAYSFTGARRSARDGQRRNDIKQYSTALEVFAAKNNGLYPAEQTAINAEADLCSDLLMTNCPADPENGSQFRYRYLSSGTLSDGSATALRYVLWALLDKTDEYYYVCSNGKVGVIARTVWVNPAGGNCPT